MQSTALRYFIEVVRAGSVRRAAEELRIAPSAVSRQIAQLEFRLKAPLFERHTNRLILTEAGHIVAKYATVMAADLRKVQTEIDDISGFRRGHVRVATVEAMVAHVLPKCLASFQGKYPALTVSVEILGTFDVVGAVLRDTADIGLAFCPEDREDVDVKLELSQPLYAVMAPKHSLAAEQEISILALKGQRVALPEESFGIRRLIDAVALKNSVDLSIQLETNSIEMVKGLARHSDLVTFLPESAIVDDVRRGELYAVPLIDDEFKAACVKVLSMKGRTLSRACEAFLDSLDAMAKEDLNVGARSGKAPKRSRLQGR